MRRALRHLAVYAAVVSLIASGTPLRAATLYWDADGTTSGNSLDGTGLGGTGVWDTAATNWWDTAGNVVWPNTTVDHAVFSGPFPAGGLPTAATVTIGAGIQAQQLSFLRSGYTLAGGSLTLAGTNPVLFAGLGESAVINSQILGTGGLTMTGGGTIRLGNNANGYTGVTTIAHGTLVITDQSALGADTSDIVVSSFHPIPGVATRRGFGGGSLMLDGSGGNITISRNLSLQGQGPIGDRGGALISSGFNTLSGTVDMGVAQSGTFISTRIIAADGTLNITGPLNVLGTAATTISSLGGTNQAGASFYNVTGVLAGTGTLEKSGGGTLHLNPSDSSGFSGTVRVTSSVAGGQSEVRISSPGVLGTRTNGTTGAVLDLNGGILAVLMDTPEVKVSNGSNANVYFRASSTIFADHPPGSSVRDQSVAFGNVSFEDNITLTFNSRNGYGMSFTTAPVNGGNNNNTITNNLQGGAQLTFVGNFWSNSDNTGNRTMTIGGAGNTTINGNIVAAAAAFDKHLTKLGAGTLTITGTGSTLDGSVSINGGTLAINDFRAINNNTSTINIGANGSGLAAGTLAVIGNNLTQANLTTSKVVNLGGTTNGATILAHQTGTSPGVIFNADFTAGGAGDKTLTLGGTNLAANTINGAIVDNSAANTTSLSKVDAGRWVLAGTNTYTGTTTISNGILQLDANALVSTILHDTSAIVFNAVNVYAGGTLEFVGQASADNVETLGVLTPTNGSGTIKLTPGSGGTASLVFASLGTVGGGGTVNITAPTSNDTVSFTATGITNNIANAGLFYNGADFAFVPGAGLALRAPVYGTDTDFATSAATLTAAASNEVTGSFSTGAALAVDSLKINGDHTLTLDGNLTIRTAGGASASGGIIQTGGSGTITGAFNVGTNNAAALVINVDGGANALNLESTLFGTGGFTKVGQGTLRLAGANAQTGTMSVNEGTVRLVAGGTLGGAAALTIRQNAVLELNGITPAANINAFNNNGIVRNTSATTDVVLTVGGSNGTGTSSGIIEDGGNGRMSLVKIGTGAQSWLGLSTYTGTTTIGSTGIVTINNLQNGGSASGIGASTSAAGNLIFNGASATQAYGGLSYAGTTNDETDRLFTFDGGADGGVRIQSNGVNGATSSWTNTGALAFGANATGNPQGLVLGGASTGDNRFFPIINDNGGAATSVFKADAGVWHLEAANGYSGATTLRGGTLYADDGASLPSASNLVFDGGSFATTGAFSRTIGTGANQMQWTSAGAGGFSAGGSPLTVNWGAGNIWGTTAGFLGTGALLLNYSGVAKADVTILSGFDLGGAVRTVTVGDNTNLGSDFATISGVISGSGGLVKNGAGILNLRGVNTYAGTTSVTQGTLVVLSLGDSSGSGGTSVGSEVGADLDANALTLGNGGTTAGILEYVGAGEISNRKIRLNTTTGSTQIHADGTGPLILTNVANDMVGGAKTLFLRGVNAAGNMVTSQLSNNGGNLAVAVDGSATWILTNGANNYGGNTTVSGGALGVGHDDALGTGTLSINNGIVFAYGGDRTIANPVTQSATSSTIATFMGDYSIELTGAWTDPSTTSSGRFIRNNIVTGKTLTIGGNYSATAGTTSQGVGFDGSGDTVVNGVISTSMTNFGITYAGTGSLTLGGANTYTGKTTISSGTLRLGADEVIPNGAVNPANNVVIINPVAGMAATLDLSGRTETINGLTVNSDGIAVIDNTSALPAALVFGANDQAVSFGGGIGTYTIQNSGGGPLSITKTGATAMTIPTGVALNYTGSTNVNGGSLTIASALNGTSGLSATNATTLALSGGIAAPNAVTSVLVDDGSILSLLDGAGNKLAGLMSLQLGSTGGTMATLNLNVGDLNTAGDELSTDTLTLLTGGTLALFAGNQITFHLTDAGLSAGQTYELLNFVDGGFTTTGPLANTDYILGATPGGFSSVTLTATDTSVFITTGTLITGTSYWRGLTDNTWNAGANNWSQDKAGTTPALSTPGQGTDVVFAYDGIAAAALVTTLEQNFKVNSLTFEAGATTPTSVTIDPGLVATNRIEIAPQVATDGIRISAGGPSAVTISAAVKVGANQTWDVADAASVLTLGSLHGEADVTKTGAGKVILNVAADPTFNGGVTADFTLDAGTLEITDSAALGNTINANLATVTINNTAAFYYNGTAGTVANALTLAGGTLSAGTANQTYSGAVNVSGNSFINMADSNGPGTNTERSITLSGAMSGSGGLTVSSNTTTLVGGNAENGTLTINNASGTWSGGLTLNSGTVDITAAASPTVIPGSITFGGLGRLIVRGVNGQAINQPGTITFTAGAVGEYLLDNTSAVLATDFVVNQNGQVNIGSGGIGASARFTINDAATHLNIAGGVVLGGNSSISVDGGDADSFVNISGIISDGGSGYSLAINDDAGGWGVSNNLIRLTGLSTFTGNISLSEGILEFDTVTNMSGGASALGNGTAISMAGGALQFIGSSAQSTDRPITTTGSVVLTAEGSGGAIINWGGAITQAVNNSLTLTGAGEGIISGGITQPAPASGTPSADLILSSGTWTIRDANSRIADDILVNSGTLNLENMTISVNDDTVVTGLSSVLNLNSAGVWAAVSAAGASSGLLARSGGTINLNADDVTGVGNSGGLDFIILGDSNAAGSDAGVLNTNTFTITTPRLDLGLRGAGLTGLINGTGTVMVAGGDINLYQGTVNANLASTGSTALEKLGPDTVILRGDNSGLASTGSTIVTDGILILDYTVNNATKVREASLFELRGANVVLNGNASAATVQNVAGLNLDSTASDDISGFGRMFLNPGAGQEIVLNLGAITRTSTNRDGTVRFFLPSGAQTAAHGFTTTSPNSTFGMLGTGATATADAAYATVDDGTGVWFATNSGGNIVALASTVKDDVATWSVGDHISDGTGFTGVLQHANINSLRFNASGGSDLVVAEGGVLNIGSGGFLITDQVGGTPSLMGGTLASGVTELVITQDSSQTFEISSDIRVNRAVTKTGTGMLLLTGDNVYTDETDIQQGTLQVAGGNAIGDASPVSLSTSRDTTFELLADETIGRLQGGLRATNSDYGTVVVGTHTLTINQSASTTYAGFFTGTGTLVMNTGGNGNLNLTNSSTGFTGEVVVNGGLFQIGGEIGRLDASSFTVNKGGNLLLDNNGNSSITTRILDTAGIILNSADGAFSGETRPRGISNRENDNVNSTETYGTLVLNSGASYVALEVSGGTSAQANLVAATGWTRNNGATLNVRGRNLGGTSAERSQFKVANANDAAMIAANVGGGGTIGGSAKNVSIIPWAVGENLTTSLADGNMGNTLVSYVDDRGFVPLHLTNEFAAFGTAAAGDNVRESLGTDLTGIVGTTINALVVNNTAFAGLDVTGSGPGQTLEVTSGAVLFTVSGGAASTAYDTTLGGFDSGITVGGTNEYVFFVVNPSSAATTALLTAIVSSPLTSTADITKSGRGTLILNAVNTAGGGANKTTINEGVLEIADLDNIGGNTGDLVFAGGTLRLGTGLTDDVSLRTILLLDAGGTIDTNGIDLALANGVGSGLGGLTKTGAGNLTLNAAATYTGATIVSGGTLTIGADDAAGNGGDLFINSGATLDLGTNGITAGRVTTSGLDPVVSGTGAITASRGFAFGNTDTAGTTVAAVLAGPGGLLKTQSNVLTLTGLNTYTGITEVLAGTLAFDSIAAVGGGPSALGAPTTIENGIIRMGLTTAATTLNYVGFGHSSDRLVGMQGTTGGLTIDADGTGALVLGGVHLETAGNKTLTLRGDSPGIVVNKIGRIADFDLGLLGVTKLDANVWELNASNAYSGTTTAGDGLLFITAAQNLTGALVFGTAATAGMLELTGADAQFGGMSVVTNSALVSNLLTVNADDTLTIAGNVTIGANANDSATLLFTSGGGTFVNVSDGGIFQVGGATGGANENSATADFAGLSSFVVNLGATGTMRIGDNSSNTGAVGSSILVLGVDSTITAGTLQVASTQTNSLQTLRLGAGTNLLNVNTLRVAGATRGVGSLNFFDSTGTVRLRGADGTSAAIVEMGVATSSTGNTMGATIDLSGHSADLLVSTLTMSERSAGSGSVNASFTFDEGLLDVDSWMMATRSGAGTGGASATVDLGDSLALGTPTTNIGNLTMAENTSAGGTVVANFNVSGGDVTIGTGIGNAVNMANAGADRTVTSNITLTGGTTSILGNIARTSGLGTENATVTLNGGSLNLNGNVIGSSLAAISFQAQSGTLSNLAELNGGTTPLDKTTAGRLVMTGVNAYTGATTVSAGVLTVNGSLTDTGAVQVNGTLNGGVSTTHFGGAAASISSDITVASGARFSAGASGNANGDSGDGVGRMDVTGNVAWTGGSTVVFDFGTNPTGTAGVDWDLLTVSGDLSYAGTGTITVQIDSWTNDLLGYGQNGGVNDFNPANLGDMNSPAYSWLWVQGAGSLSTFANKTDLGGGVEALNDFVVDPGAGSNVFANYGPLAGSFWVSSFNNDLYINYSSVPEPGSLALLGLAGIGLAGYRRRKRRQAEAAATEAIAAKTTSEFAESA